MLLDTECGICYRMYNPGSRCPRQLNCKHTFCESCLVTLAGSKGREALILCPVCRHLTPLSEETIRRKLPVDEHILERLDCLEGGADDGDSDDPDDPNVDPSSQPKEERRPQTSPRGPVVRSIRRLWRKILGDGRSDCMTDQDLRDLAMMSFYMT